MRSVFLLFVLLFILGCTIPNFGLNVIPKESYSIKIKWLGHAGFLIETNHSRVYINPYSAPVGSLKGDLILVSYSSSDLCDPDSIIKLSKDYTRVIAPPECAARLGRANIESLKHDYQFSFNDLIISTVSAYNLNGTISKNEGAGFIITYNNTRIYYMGITDFIPEINNISDIDVLILPIAGGDLSINMSEGVDIIKRFNASYNIPMYYGGNTGTSLDKGRVFKTLAEASGFNVTLLSNQDLLIN